MSADKSPNGAKESVESRTKGGGVKPTGGCDPSSVMAFVESLRAIPALPGWSARQAGRSGMWVHRPEDVATEARYLAELGIIGLLPFGKLSNGDQLALLPSAGKPLSDWRVVEARHSGHGIRTLAESLRAFPAVYVAHHEATSQAVHRPPDEQREQARVAFGALGRFLGDEGRAGDVFAVLEEQRWPDRPSPLDAFRLAEPEGRNAAFYEAVHAVVVLGSDPVETFSALYERFPRYAAGQALLLKAAEVASDAKSRHQAAMALVTGVHPLDNRQGLAGLKSTQLQAPEGMGLRDFYQLQTRILWRQGEPLAAAIESLAADATLAGISLNGLKDQSLPLSHSLRVLADELEAHGALGEALRAYCNACHASWCELEEVDLDAMEGAKRRASQLDAGDVAQVYSMALGLS